MVVVVLAAHNVVANRVLPSALYVPVNLMVAAGLLALARARGVSWKALGISRETLGRGAAVGGATFLVVAVVLVIAGLVPVTRPLFEDERAARLGGGAVAYHVLVRIPLGTVVLEEVAFRGVVLALLLGTTTTRAAVAWSSALFGLWHIVPTFEALETNRLDAGVLPLAGAVVVTAAAGVAFCWLRLRSQSLLAPALAHLATNDVALVVAFVVLRRAGAP